MTAAQSVARCTNRIPSGDQDIALKYDGMGMAKTRMRFLSFGPIGTLNFGGNSESEPSNLSDRLVCVTSAAV